MQEQGKFPSQTQPNPKGVHELSFSTEPTPRMDEVKVIITLRSGKQVDQPVPIPFEETKEEKEVEPEHIIIKEDSMKKSMPPPFPQALKGKKKASSHTEILEVLRQVKVNIPLLYMIKQVSTVQHKIVYNQISATITQQVLSNPRAKVLKTCSPIFVFVMDQNTNTNL